jgi:hypothetical protein
MSGLHVIFLSKITPTYFTIFTKGLFYCWSNSIGEVELMTLVFIRGSEKREIWGVVRDTTMVVGVGQGNNIFGFEGSQAVPLILLVGMQFVFRVNSKF